MASGGRREACADCSATEPTWAILNRGLLVCTECAGLHRSLGRHVSQLRSLAKSAWAGQQLSLVHALHTNGANNIWEHGLLTSAHQRLAKPAPTDPLHPTKAEFIRAKHAHLAFALRAPKEEGPLNQADLDRQLWSCVRTGHVETTLRLLALGADPNAPQAEHRQTAPLHVAAKEAQPLQVELLVLYGADPGQPDAAGQRPSDVAAAEKHTELAARLRQLEFEITDRLSLFLCSKRAEHAPGGGSNYLIPELAGAAGELAGARSALRRLAPVALEKLLGDVYDEVDRRETETAWVAALGPAQAALQAERHLVPFLPVNPDFTATRNQSRQKLAKFPPRQFAALLIALLGEVKRRDVGASGEGERPNSASLPPSTKTTETGEEEAEDYDDVPRSPPRESSRSVAQLSSTGAIHSQSSPSDKVLSPAEVSELREALAASEARVDSLASSQETILAQLSNLSASLARLNQENVSLRRQVQALQAPGTVARLNGQPQPQPQPPALEEEMVWKRREETSLAAAEPPPVYPKPRPPALLSTTTAQFPSMMRAAEAGTLSSSSSRSTESDFPATLVGATERLTRQIQCLLTDAQAGKAVAYGAHASAIQGTVDDLVKLVPPSARSESERLDEALEAMVEHCISLTVQCGGAAEAGASGRQEGLSCQVVQAAYDVAKAAKATMSAIQLPHHAH